MTTAASTGNRKPVSFLRGSLVTTGTRLLDLPSRYGLHLLIAARLQIAELGAFYIVFSVMTITAGFGRLGVDRALTKEVASALGQEKPQTARRAIRRAFLVTLAQSGAIALALAALAHPVAIYLLHKPGLAIPLVLGALTIVPQNLSTTAAGALAGLNRVPTSQMIYSWLWPALFCVAALTMPLDVPRTLLLIFTALVINAIAGIGLMLRALPPRVVETEPVVLGRFLGVGISFFSLELVQLAFASAPAFVLGMVASTASVGLYAIAWRIVLVLNLLVSAVAAIASPEFARLAAIKEHRALRRVAAQSVALTMGLSGLPIIMLAVNPVFFLGLFGHGYGAAGTILRILLAGQTTLVFCAAVPELMGMTGHARSLTKTNVASLGVLVVLLAALTPKFGTVGAASATAITMLLNGILVTWAAKRKLGFIPLVELVRYARRQLESNRNSSAVMAIPSSSPVQDSPSSDETMPDSTRMF